MSPKDADGMANSTYVDPNQTAPLYMYMSIMLVILDAYFVQVKIL